MRSPVVLRGFRFLVKAEQVPILQMERGPLRSNVHNLKLAFFSNLLSNHSSLLFAIPSGRFSSHKRETFTTGYITGFLIQWQVIKRSIPLATTLAPNSLILLALLGFTISCGLFFTLISLSFITITYVSNVLRSVIHRGMPRGISENHSACPGSKDS